MAFRVESLSRLSHRRPFQDHRPDPTKEPQDCRAWRARTLMSFPAYKALLSTLHTTVLLERLQGKLPHVGEKEVG